MAVEPPNHPFDDINPSNGISSSQTGLQQWAFISIRKNRFRTKWDNPVRSWRVSRTNLNESIQYIPSGTPASICPATQKHLHVRLFQTVFPFEMWCRHNSFGSPTATNHQAKQPDIQQPPAHLVGLTWRLMDNFLHQMVNESQVVCRLQLLKKRPAWSTTYILGHKSPIKIYHL